MKRSLLFLFFLAFALAACDGDPKPFDCNTDGCGAGWHCDTVTTGCVQDCTAGGCDDGYCDPDSRECAGYLTFPDPALAACVEAAAGVGPGELTTRDASAVTALYCPDAGISDLTGLERLTNLTRLSVWENQVTDLSPLSGLTSLTEVQAGFNDLADLTPLAALTGLTRLGLAQNRIASVDSLAGLVQLKHLNLDKNAISELAPLASLTDLTWLSIEDNAFTEDAVLDTLAAAGTEVYTGFQSAKRLGVPRLPAVDTGCVRPAMEAHVAADGRLTHSAVCGGRSLPVRAEDGGRLFVEDGIIQWTRDDLRAAVGRLVDGRPVWHAPGEGCTLLFSNATSAGAPALSWARPVITTRLQCPTDKHVFKDGVDSRAFALESELLPSPNQFDAGSCLFMATTGAVEILLNQHVDGAPSSEGDTDLSERWLLNAYMDVPIFAYFITDLFATFNHFTQALPNTDFRFTADYVVEDAEGNIERVPAGTEDSFLSCRVNWLYELDEAWQDTAVDVPEVGRTLVFVDPDLDDNSIWNVGIMDGDVVERIKHELVTKNAPVLLVYNHYLYWHATLIVGYDDEADAGDCPFVRDAIDYYREQGADAYATKIEAAMTAQGGCSTTGVFYVRDSIYTGGASEADYTYNTDPAVVDKYSKTVVTHEYDWARYLGNHAYTLHRR